MAHIKSGNEAQHLIPQISLQGREADTHQSCLRSYTILLDETGLDPQRHPVSPSKHMFPILVERESVRENLCMDELGVTGPTKRVGEDGVLRDWILSHKPWLQS